MGPGVCGDDPDSHAGTNETSLMLACSPGRVRQGYRSVRASLPPARRGAAKLVGGLAIVARLIGGRTLGRDLDHLANTLAWVNDPEMIPYMGDPSKATREAGEAMLAARVDVAMDLFERALANGVGPESAQEPVHIELAADQFGHHLCLEELQLIQIVCGQLNIYSRVDEGFPVPVRLCHNGGHILQIAFGHNRLL